MSNSHDVRAVLCANPELREAAEALLDGASLLRDVENFYRRFVVLTGRAYLPLCLWTLATFMFQDFDSFPYLAVLSPTKGCGKTRLTEVIALLASNARRAVNISEAALFRLIESCSPTLVLDEAEALTAKSDRADAIRALLNSGNRKNASVPRCVGNTFKLKEFSVFCPKVIVGISVCPETIRDRSLVIWMQRRKRGEEISRFRHRAIEPEAIALRESISSFVAARRQEIADVYGKLDLIFLRDRDADSWEVLFSVLAIADPSRNAELKKCAEALTEQKTDHDVDDSLPLRLLADLRAIWNDGEVNMLTTDLLAALKNLEESPWAEEVPLNPRKLARMLRGFGVVRGQVRTRHGVGKGYRFDELEPAFLRYLALER